MLQIRYPKKDYNLVPQTNCLTSKVKSVLISARRIIAPAALRYTSKDVTLRKMGQAECS